MRPVLAITLFVTTVSLAATTGSSAESTSGCKLLTENTARIATGEDEVLKTEDKANGLFCRFETGPSEPASIPKEARVRVNLELTLTRFSGKALKNYAAEQCALAHMGHYPEEACTYAHMAVKAADPLRSFQLLHRSFLEMGTADKAGGFGDPAFIVEFSPPLVGTELWIYRESEKKVLVATCIELRTSGKLPDNGHFPSCSKAAAHAALVKLP
jgi:hypothetical protein